MVFSKIAQAGGGGEPGIFGFSFIFSFNGSALDHSATVPLSFPKRQFDRELNSASKEYRAPTSIMVDNMATEVQKAH